MGMHACLSIVASVCYSKLTKETQFDRQATPRLSEDKVRQCVDPRLEGEYPPKAVAKVKN
jgi:hypothetical protein